MTKPTNLDLRLLGMRDTNGCFAIGTAVKLVSLREALARMIDAGWITQTQTSIPMEALAGATCDVFQVTSAGAALIPATVSDGKWPRNATPEIKQGARRNVSAGYNYQNRKFGDIARHVSRGGPKTKSAENVVRRRAEISLV